MRDLRHLLLTHIHLDHAAAAGSRARAPRDLIVHVSEIGAPHLVDPSRLERSARIYEDTFDALFGELAPVPEANVHVVGERVGGLECFRTPGHASHHVCYARRRDGLLRATRPVSGSSRAASSPRTPRRRTSTSRRGRNLRRAGAAVAGQARRSRSTSDSSDDVVSTSPRRAGAAVAWAERVRYGADRRVRRLGPGERP